MWGGGTENKESRGNVEGEHGEGKNAIEKTEGGNNKREKSSIAIYPTLLKRSLTSSKEFFFKKKLQTARIGRFPLGVKGKVRRRLLGGLRPIFLVLRAGAAECRRGSSFVSKQSFGQRRKYIYNVREVLRRRK